MILSVYIGFWDLFLGNSLKNYTKLAELFFIKSILLH